MHATQQRSWWVLLKFGAFVFLLEKLRLHTHSIPRLRHEVRSLVTYVVQPREVVIHRRFVKLQMWAVLVDSLGRCERRRHGKYSC